MPRRTLASRLFLVFLLASSTSAVSAPFFLKAVFSSGYLALASPKLQANPSLAGAITVTWSPVTNATGYVLESSNTGKGGSFTQLRSFSASDRSFRHTGLYYSQKMYYRIKAVANAEESVYSQVVSATTHGQGYAYRVMPLGDSNTEGGDSYTVPPAERIGYRKNLYRQLVLNGLQEGYAVDFVGSQRMGGAYSEAFQLANGFELDIDHAGFGGARDEDIAALLENGEYNHYGQGMRGPGGGPYLDKYHPDVILLHIGTNQVDGSERAMEDVKKLLDQIDLYEARVGKEVTVIVAKIIRRVCYTDSDGNRQCRTPRETENTLKYNSMLERYVNERIAAGDRLELIDMQDGAGIDYRYTYHGGDMADFLHPAQEGYDKMVPVWFRILRELLEMQSKTPPDTQAPAAPSITGITEDRGPVANDYITSDNTLKLSGKAEANAEVTLFEKGIMLGKVKVSGTGSWEFDYAQEALAQGTYRFTAAATDAAGNTGAASADFVVQVDLTAPTVRLSTTSSAAVKDTFYISIKFSEEVYGISADDFNVTNGTLSNLVSSGKATYTALVTPANDGAVRVGITAGKVMDLAGNANEASDALEVESDVTKPKVALTSDAPPTLNVPFVVSFTFSEAVTGFELGDIMLVNGTASDFTKVGASLYTTKIYPSADGEVSVRVPADKAFDRAENGNEASATLSRKYDMQRPAVVLHTDAPDPVNKPFVIKVRFSKEVSGFGKDKLNVTNGVASQLNKEDALTYTVLITPAGDGEVAVRVAANVVQDLAANGNEASNELALVYDADRPAVSISTDAPEKTNKAFTATFQFSEAVSGFELSDIRLANAVAENLTRISDLRYTARIRPAQDGMVVAAVPENRVHDAASNGNTASSRLERLYDATAPVGYAIRFSVREVDVNNQTHVPLEVTGAEVGAHYTYLINSDNGGVEVTGTAIVSSSSFTIPDLDLSGLADGLLNVHLYLVDAQGNKGENVTSQVEKLIKDVASVSNLPGVKVPFKTKFSMVPLPEKVEVTFTHGDKEDLGIEWGEGNFNETVASVYVLTGQLQLKGKMSNRNNLMAQITVEVEANQAPAAISLSNSTFEPDINPEEAIGYFSTADPDDDAFTYTLVSGQGDTHNQFFKIENNHQLHLKSNKGLSGVNSFTIRVRSADSHGNAIEQNFKLTKALYQPQDKIKLVNAFSPDGDGINDFWIIPELQYYNQVEVEVFNRAGIRLFHSSNPGEGWDGRGENGRISAGSYFYIIQVKDINLVQKGVVTVLK